MSGGDTDLAEWASIRQAVFDGVMAATQADEGYDYDQEWVTEITDAVMARIEDTALVCDHAAANQERDALRAVVKDLEGQVLTYLDQIGGLWEFVRAYDAWALPQPGEVSDVDAARAALGDTDG